jgi:hypothetical protein
MPRLALLVVLACAACAAEFPARRSERSLAAADLSAAADAEPAAKSVGGQDAPPVPVPARAEGPPVTSPARSRAVLLYTAQVTMAVFDVQPGLRAIEALAREVGGYPARQSANGITIRIPAARFDETLERLEKLGDVTARQVEAEDVTAEYVDLEMRLKNARSVRARLEQLLAQAAKVADAIAIERELERVGGDIERLEGRLRYLQDRAQLSTITVTFFPRPRELVAKDAFKLPFPWLDQLGLSRLLDLR